MQSPKAPRSRTAATATPATGPERLLTPEELSELWSCSKSHIYNLISRGELRIVDLGNGRAKTRIPESAAAEYVARRSRQPKATRAA